MSEKYIPVKVLEMCILMINAAEQCDQCGSYDRELRAACKRIMEWADTPDYSLTCEKARVAKDVEPVRHSRWLNRKRNGYAVLVCSECEREKEGYTRTAYCPHCGVKMDGGAEK